MPSRPNVSKGNVMVTLSGVPEMELALLGWRERVDQEFRRAQNRIERLAKDGVKKVLTSGKSRTVHFEPLAPMSQAIASASKMPGRRPSGSLPFKGGTGELARKIRAKSSIGQIRKDPKGRGAMFSVEVDVPPDQQKKAAILTWGARVRVSRKMQKYLAAMGVKYTPKVNKVLIIPPRDFLAAGVQDVKEQLADEYDRVIAKANVRTTAAMPRVQRPKFVKGTGAARKGGAVPLVKGFKRGKGGRIPGSKI